LGSGPSRNARERRSALDGSIAKAKGLSSFLPQEIRYVAIEVGIGASRPHPADEVFKDRYGD
jgi:hypothetical protein